MSNKKRQFKYTLMLSGVAKLDPDIANSLYEATRGDIELNMRADVVFLDFNRKAKNLQEAVTSAILDVERASAGIRVIRVERIGTL